MWSTRMQRSDSLYEKRMRNSLFIALKLNFPSSGLKTMPSRPKPLRLTPSVTGTDNAGNNALHQLLLDIPDLKAPLRNELIKVAVLLIGTHGVDAHARNLHGRTPLDYARDFERQTIKRPLYPKYMRDLLN